MSSKLVLNQDGIVRRLTWTLFNCRNEDGFVKMKSLNNCSCMAYTNSDISRYGSGCYLWFGNLVGTRKFTDDRQDLYIIMASSEVEKKENITEEHSLEESLDLPHFDFSLIANETNDFSFNNLLGKGGFGSVYKAMFNGGQYIIAVKRLSKESRQGLDEFMNASKMHCEASTSKPHKASGILQRARREDFDL
uniref:Protein kinase domain-containing protein n=1 Tax=Salix viminalis TaxID=40686 RepID=A0A6N2MBM1_SALVM